MHKGLWYAIGAYLTWGLFPVYWKWLEQVPAVQLIGHRIDWSFVMLLGIILVTRQWKKFRAAALTGRVLRIYTVSALLIGSNWLIYVWAVTSGYIVEASLGYFINPLFSVLLGMLFLRERLRPLQWLPVGLAAAGVLYLTFIYGSLAFTFGLYGLVKKTAPLGSLYGLTLETGLLFLPALAYLLYVNATGSGAFLHSSPTANLLMVGAGLVTIVPLLMFSSAARQIPLSLVGILQYITPSMQFLLGVLVYREAFSLHQLLGFGIVWLGLIIFWAEGFFAHRAAQPIIAPAD